MITKRIVEINVLVFSVLFLSIAPTLAWAVPPEVVRTTPKNGDQNVNPSLRSIRIVFDQDMDDRGYSICGGGPTFPKMIGKPRWVNKRTIIMRVKLTANHDYSLSVNSVSFQNYRSVQGEPAVPYPIRFRTASGKGGGRQKPSDEKSRKPKTDGKKLTFSLSDVFGRKVRSQDYKGVPIFLEFGGCW